MQFQHSSEHDELQTTAWVRFQVANHDASTLQSRNMHITGKYGLVCAPVFQFVKLFKYSIRIMINASGKASRTVVKHVLV